MDIDMQPRASTSTRSGPTGRSAANLAIADLNTDTEDEHPIAQLTRHWMNERHAPDLLPAQVELLNTVLDHIRRQSSAVLALRADPDPSDTDHARLTLVQTDIERAKFLVRAYVRARLAKVESHARYIMTHPETQERISKAELDHARRHASLTDRHLYLSVLQALPPAQATLDDAPLFVPPMVHPPPLHRPVFARARVACGPVRLPDNTALPLAKGDIYLLPYETVAQLVERGEVDLV
ncbi:GINS complex, Sld5 component [Schizophyllum commune Tattone D]|nr:GINS complex, Sld5 component [Schizophyllum commune Tattone D]